MSREKPVRTVDYLILAALITIVTLTAGFIFHIMGRL